uniref:Zona pellucida protein AX 2 n=1 Tax=Salarias fasciatus TaxID=181472 RepID=A0A672H231_SALFA
MRHLPGLFGFVICRRSFLFFSVWFSLNSTCISGGSLYRSAVILTKSLASQCGFSMKIDRLGNAVIYVSLQNCFALNLVTLDFTCQKAVHLYQVTETCLYSEWTSREIVCDHNYMEASDCSRGLGSCSQSAWWPVGALILPHLILVSFTSNLITWYLPRHIDPLISSGQFQLLEVHMGVDGQRLTPSEVQARRYSISVSDVHIVIDIPLGAAGGFFKVSDEPTYMNIFFSVLISILLWTEDAGHEHTRYKVLFPITTPLIPQPPKVIDNTVPEQQVFKLVLGHFAPDVALVNITFPTGVLSLEECIVRGFKVLEHLSPNGTFKAFTLEVPFTDPVVLQMVRNPPPSVVGSCDNLNFYILVKYGTQGPNFQTIVGKQVLTQELAKDYGFWENETHFSLVVPFSAPAVVIEAIQSTSLRSRLDVVLKNPETNVHIQEFALACNFFSVLTECFSNGTMTAIALKLESVPTLNPALLTLRDPSCGPVHSNDRYAYFVFTANSCGTTRKVPSRRPTERERLHIKRMTASSLVFSSRLKVSCYYDINTTHAVSFHTRPRRSEPFAENAKGQHQVELRLALGERRPRVEDYPISKPLLQPLYFEVALIKAANPKVSLELENCWGTLNEDRTSQPRWNLIINGCPNPVDPYQVIFHPVWPDARVQHPSLYKRFEVKMFAFAEDQDNLSGQVLSSRIKLTSVFNDQHVCNGQCPNPQNGTRGKEFACMVRTYSIDTCLWPLLDSDGHEPSPAAPEATVSPISCLSLLWMSVEIQ